MENDNGIIGWVLAGVATVIGTLSTIIAKFYHAQITDYKLIETKLESAVAALRTEADECKVDREELRIEVGIIKDRLSRIESK